MLLRLAMLLLALPLAAEDSWPMKGHDERRTGRASVNGPRKGNDVWRYVARDGVLINMEPTLTEKGVFFGTWGLIRRHGKITADFDKADGRVYGLSLDGKPLWEPLLPAHTPFGYRFDKRPREPQDGPVPEPFHLNWYNGTIEGTPAVDPSNGRLYVGRGDGAVYCIDPVTGQVVWRFLTTDPSIPDDPEGGGEVIGGPLVVGERILFATGGCPPCPDPPKLVRHETNAIYAIDRDGKLLWRTPAKGGEENPFIASLALSPDGQVVYAVGSMFDPRRPTRMVALEIATGREVWGRTLEKHGGHDLAVGCDGVVYVAGMKAKFLGCMPIAFAVDGATGKTLWGPIEVEGNRSEAHFSGGVALFEEGGRVKDVWISTTPLRDHNKAGGALHRLDPKTGKVLQTWRPADSSPSCVGGLTDVTLDAEGAVYVGVRGQSPWGFTKEVRGRMYALRPVNGGMEVLWSLELDHQIDWGSPAIGPDGGLYFGSSDTIGVAHILARGADEDVKDADPVFFGVRDR